MHITNTSDLFLRNCYQNGTLFFESDKPQTVELFLPLSGLYELTLVGGGGGADGGCYHKGTHHSHHYTRSQTGRGGGSGAAFKGQVFLQRGNYLITVGGAGGGAGRGGKGGNTAGSGGNTFLAKRDDGAIIASASGGEGSGSQRYALCFRESSYAATPGRGGICSVTSGYIFKNIELQQNGLAGSGTSGGNSVFSGTNYGKGGNANSGSGIGGYAKLMMI